MFTPEQTEYMVNKFGSMDINLRHICPLKEIDKFYDFLSDTLSLKLMHLDLYAQKLNDDENYSAKETIDIQKECLIQIRKLAIVKELVAAFYEEQSDEWFNLFYKGLQVTMEIRLENLEAHIQTITDSEQLEKLAIEKEKFTELIEYAKQQPCAVPLYTVKEN